jgi:hypothetical protein
MIKLEKTFKSGAGAIVRNYTQLARTEKVAMYIRDPLEGDKGFPDYEVFVIKIQPKGFKITLPGKEPYFTDDDMEKYPCNTDFGRSAWSITNRARALARYAELCEKSDIVEGEEEETTKLIIPLGEWSTKELAEANKVEYPQASIMLKEALAIGSIKFARAERRNVKGKPTNLYSKA